MTWMITNSRGRPDALLTFSAGAVAVVLVKVLVHGATFRGIDLGDIDAGIIAAVLGPTLGAYTWKRTAVDKAQAAEVPAPPRGFTLWGIALLAAIGFGIYAFAMGAR